MNNLTIEENKLFEEWIKLIDTQTIFAKDGAGENYPNAKTKILFIAKETNDTKNDWDTRYYLNDGVFYKNTGKPISRTFNNIYRWANLFINDINEFKSYNKVPSNKDLRKNIFSQIAMINLKKTTGKATTNQDKFKLFIKNEHIKLLNLKQINLYNSDIIICCGKDVFDGFINTVEKDNISEIHKIYGCKYTKFNNSIVIDFYHPQSRITKKKQFEILLNIKKEYYKII